MLNCRPAKGAKATQCVHRGGSHPNAPRGVLPGALRRSSPSWLPGPTRPAATELTHLWKEGRNPWLSFLSSRAHPENLDKWRGYGLPTRLLTVHPSYRTSTTPVRGTLQGQTMTPQHLSSNRAGSTSQAHFSAPEGDGCPKGCGLSLELHPALSSTL